MIENESDDEGAVTEADLAEARERWADKKHESAIGELFSAPVYGKGFRGDVPIERSSKDTLESIDAAGHEHAEKGKHGGQFVKGPAYTVGKKPSELKGSKVTAKHGEKHPETGDKEGPKEAEKSASKPAQPPAEQGKKEPLVIPSKSPGVFYRIQWAGDPLSAKWKSENFQTGKKESGTSAVHSLGDAIKWASRIGGAPVGNVEIIGFRGEEVGTGDDGEPLVKPSQELVRLRNGQLKGGDWNKAADAADDQDELIAHLAANGWIHEEPKKVEGGKRPDDIRKQKRTEKPLEKERAAEPITMLPADASLGDKLDNPYRVTKTAFMSSLGGNADMAAYRHRKGVEDAIAAGKAVPSEVLADYPDLVPPPAADMATVQNPKPGLKP